MAESIHTARWLNMVRDPRLRFVLLPILGGEVVQALRSWRSVATADDLAALEPGEMGVYRPFGLHATEVAALNGRIGYQSFVPSFLPPGVPFAQPFHLMEAIRRFEPDIVHSMEVQMAGYLCLACREHAGTEFPFWLLSNWGSDIYLYRKLPEHQVRLGRIARTMDAYLAECRRDVAIIREMDFRGIVLPPVPASGGQSFGSLPAMADLDPPSRRREIVVKGYHGWSGRSLHILAALRMIASSLAPYTTRVTLASPAVREAAMELAAETGLDVVCDDHLPSHEEALKRIGRSRVTVGLGISDGISTTLLEAMALGSFPIQANTSCGDEWIRDGETGFLVSPHDIAGLAEAIHRAVTDDALVDAAWLANRAVVEARWDSAVNGQMMVARYLMLVDGAGRARRNDAGRP
jgi:hypothetical protein